MRISLSVEVTEEEAQALGRRLGLSRRASRGEVVHWLKTTISQAQSHLTERRDDTAA